MAEQVPKVGTAAREYWKTLKTWAEAQAAHARGEITDEELAAIRSPAPAPLGEVVQAIKKAPEGSLGAMLRNSGRELVAEVARRVGKKP